VRHILLRVLNDPTSFWALLALHTVGVVALISLLMFVQQ
jgi:hypothetical protein